MRQGLVASRTGPSVRLLLAAMGPLMLRLAGELADEVIFNTGSSPGYIRWAVDQARAGSELAGRDPAAVSVAVWLPVYLEATGGGRVDALGRARRWAAGMLSIPKQGELLLRHAGLEASFLPELRSAYGVYPPKGDIARGADLVPPAIARTLAIVGDEAQVLNRLPEYLEAGAHTLVLGLAPLRQILKALESPSAM